jgi:hypothetical protein
MQAIARGATSKLPNSVTRRMLPACGTITSSPSALLSAAVIDVLAVKPWTATPVIAATSPLPA